MANVTIKDVAKEVGVASSTVSRVLSDHPSISEATKEKVRKAMDELGYVPNISARNLVTQFVNTIGIILPVMSSTDRQSNPFYLEIINTMNEEANKHNVTIAIASGKNTEELLKNIDLMYRQKRVDGFIMLYSKEDDPVLDYLHEQKVPFTMIGQPYKYMNDINCVDNDNRLLGFSAAEYLIENGHEEIYFVTNNVSENFFQERFEGYTMCMKQHELTIHEPVPLISPEDYVSFKKLLNQGNMTACIGIDDIFSLRLIQLINFSGFKVPDDVSVISFNNSVFTSLIHPYTTSIDINVNQLGATAVNELLEQLKNSDNKKRIMIPHTLIKNETVKQLIKCVG